MSSTALSSVSDYCLLFYDLLYFVVDQVCMCDCGKCKALLLGLLSNKYFLLLFLLVNVLKEEDNTLKPVDSSDNNLHLLSSLRMHGDDDDELRMLASLKREQEEDECRASGLSASQIHHCNVSISMSSDDASTWTHISMVCTVILSYNLIFYCWFFTNEQHSCAAHLLFTIISTLSLSLSPVWNNFFDPGGSSHLLISISRP